MQSNYHDQLDNLKNKILSYIDLKPENKWHLELNEKGYSVHSTINPQNGLKTSRTETIQPIPGDQFFDLVYDMNRRVEFDNLIEEAKVLEIIDDNTQIVYGRGKAPMFLIAPRDFIYVIKKYKLEDGTLISVAQSILYPQKPEIKNVIRAHLEIQFCIVKQLSPTQCSIITIVNMDPKGSIPKILVNQGAKYQAKGVQDAVQRIKNLKK